MPLSRSWFGRLLFAGALSLIASLLVPALAASPTPQAQPVILVLGDSLSAGHGVAVDATWVALLQRRLAEQGYGYRVVNASISGETTGGARPRLPRALQLHKPAIVIVELGGNDGLRALPIAQVRDNLASILSESKTAGASPMLVGMRIPPNYGPGYTEQFHAMYSDLANRFQVPLLGFFLDGVALNDKLIQADGIHPTAQAQPLLLKNLWPVLQPLLKK